MISCRTVRQQSNEKTRNKAVALGIKGTPGSLDGKPSVGRPHQDWLARVTGGKGRRRCSAPDMEPFMVFIRTRLAGGLAEMYGPLLSAKDVKEVRTGIGYSANHTERCRARIQREWEREPEGAARAARDRELESGAGMPSGGIAGEQRASIFQEPNMEERNTRTKWTSRIEQVVGDEWIETATEWCGLKTAFAGIAAPPSS